MDQISDGDDSNRDNKFIRHILYSTQNPTRFGSYCYASRLWYVCKRFSHWSNHWHSILE